MTFSQWMQKVDYALMDICGLGAYDLADMPYHDKYDAGYTTREMAEETLADNGYPVELLAEMLADG